MVNSKRENENEKEEEKDTLLYSGHNIATPAALSQESDNHQRKSMVKRHENRPSTPKHSSSAPTLIEGQPLIDNPAASVEKQDAIVRLSESSSEDFSTQCGIGRYRPPCLQMFADRSWMLFWMCWFCLVQGMLVNGLLPSVLSTIERRFDFSTPALGRIMQFYDIGYVICCIPVSYFGGRHSKPLFLGLGLLIMGCGSFLFSLPHIMSDPYTKSYETRETSRCLDTVKNRVHQNVSSRIFPSSAGGIASSALTSISDSAQASASCVDQSQSNFNKFSKFVYQFLFCFAHFLHGVGATPLFTLGVSYIDENVKPTMSSVYIGVFYAFAIFGPAIGFLLSGTFLRYHTDFLQAERERKIMEIDESDPHWVGAWWIGFQVASILSVLAVFPILSFPKALPGASKWYKARLAGGERKGSVEERGPLEGAGCSVPLKCRSSTMSTDTSAVELPLNSGNPGPDVGVSSRSKPVISERSSKDDPILWRLWGDVRHIPAAAKRLLTNPTYMFVTLAAAVDGLLITGLSTFMSKYLERQFNLASSKSSMLQGCIMVPVAGLGTMASGYIVKKYRLTCQNTLKFCIVMVVFCLVLTPMFLVYCDHSPLVGLEMSYPGQRTNNITEPLPSLKSKCNAHCDCSRTEYRPVCAEGDGETFSFYSPCYAGCSQPYEALRKLYNNCTCAPKAKPVKKGLCEAKCSGLIGFLVLFAPMVLCTFCVGVPALSVVLRCVDYNERSFALGLQWVLIRCIGTIPAPVLFAWLFDISCVRPITSQINLDTRCTTSVSQPGSCFVYDNKLLADLFLAFGLVGQTGTLLFLVLALVFYGRQHGSEDPIVAEAELEMAS